MIYLAYAPGYVAPWARGFEKEIELADSVVSDEIQSVWNDKPPIYLFSTNAFILRILEHIRLGSIKCSDVRLVACEKNKYKNVKVKDAKVIRISHKGELIDPWPDSLFEYSFNMTFSESLVRGTSECKVCHCKEAISKEKFVNGEWVLNEFCSDDCVKEYQTLEEMVQESHDMRMKGKDKIVTCEDSASVIYLTEEEEEKIVRNCELDNDEREQNEKC